MNKNKEGEGEGREGEGREGKGREGKGNQRTSIHACTPHSFTQRLGMVEVVDTSTTPLPFPSLL